MDERLEIARVELERAAELAQRFLLAADQREGDADEVVDIGEGTTRRDDFLEQIDGPVIILDREALARPRRVIVQFDRPYASRNQPTNRRIPSGNGVFGA